ncbi:MAG: glucokinase [Anaerolineales bacterium]|nr:glucokinase [Anaerolineales bacterium]
MILAGDLGATKTHLAVFSPEKGPRHKLAEEKFQSRDFSSLEDLIHSFLDQVGYTIEVACFGVAGPVVNGEASITNLSWQLSEDTLAKKLHMKTVTLLNDLVAAATAVPVLEDSDFAVLNQGTTQHGGTIGVIAPGTGLGEGYLIWNGAAYQPYPSEGGHTDFAPTNKLEAELLRYLWKSYDHISYERLASGIGLPNIYAFLKETSYAESPSWLEKQLQEAEDQTPVLVNAALQKEDPPAICRKTLEMFISILGAEAGNLALKVLATGGIYLGGGIPPRILSALHDGTFMQSFTAKGRFLPFMENIPVRIILHPETALFGASIRGLEEWQKRSKH